MPARTLVIELTSPSRFRRRSFRPSRPRSFIAASWQGEPISTPPPASPPPSKPRFRVSWQLLALIIGLLVINFWFGSRATRGPVQVRVPYSPYFLTQVSD